MKKCDSKKVLLVFLLGGLFVSTAWAGQAPVGVPQTSAPVGGAAAAAAGGRGRGAGLPGATPEQTQVVADMNTALAPLVAAATTARNELGTVAMLHPKDASGIAAAVEMLRAAELALATARAEAFAKVQAGPNRLSEAQVTALIATFQSGGAGGRGAGGRGPAADGRGGGAGRGSGVSTAPTTNGGR
jgi:hypothetical protein